VNRLSLSSHTASRATFRELTEATAAAGVPAIALTYAEYRRFAEAGERDAEMVAAARDNGVKVVDIEAVYAVLEPDPSGRTAAYADRLFALAELFGAESIGVHSNVEGDIDTAAERLARFCDRAAARGLGLGVEPVPVMGLRDLATAWEIMVRAERPNMGLVLDTWHFSRGAGSLDMIRSLPGNAFKTVQISDGWLHPDPGVDYLQDTLTNRMLPGQGEFDLDGIIRALQEIGANVAWDMEICSSALDRLPGHEAAQRAADATRSVLAAAGQSVAEGSRGR
jgi:sugar phosphate isomerase/epimerase